MSQDQLSKQTVYRIPNGESLDVFLHTAFTEIGIDPFDQDTQLNDWLDTEAVESVMQSESGIPLVNAVVWNHDVQIESGRISIGTGV